MNNFSNLIIQVEGKNMYLNVYDDRVELYKPSTQKVFSFRYESINRVMFRLTSSANTGFIKVRAQSGMFDFVTYKFKREPMDQVNFLQGQLTAAKNEIDARVKAAKGLPPASTVVTYY